MEILKSDLNRFKSIQDFPYKENYVDFDGMQMHYIDEGNGETILALHGEPSWSYLYRKFIPVLKNYRFIAPDLIGFGKSDNIVGWKNYTFEMHFNSLVNLIEKLGLNDITLVVQDWGGLLGLSVLGEYPEKIKRVVVLNTFLPVGDPLPFKLKVFRRIMSLIPSFPVGMVMQKATFSKLPKHIIEAYEAPFPNKKHKDGAYAFPQLLPINPSGQGVTRMRKAREVLSKWTKPALVMFSDRDEVLTPLHSFFIDLIPTSQEHDKIVIKDAGHFLQEDKGEEIATFIDMFIKDELKNRP